MQVSGLQLKTPIQLFSSEFWGNFKTTFPIKHHWVAASEYLSSSKAWFPPPWAMKFDRLRFISQISSPKHSHHLRLFKAKLIAFYKMGCFKLSTLFCSYKVYKQPALGSNLLKTFTVESSSVSNNIIFQTFDKCLENVQLFSVNSIKSLYVYVNFIKAVLIFNQWYTICQWLMLKNHLIPSSNLKGW